MGKRAEYLVAKSCQPRETPCPGVYPPDLEAREGRALTPPSQGRAASPESTTYQSAQAKAWARRRIGTGQESQDRAMGQGGGAVQGAELPHQSEEARHRPTPAAGVRNHAPTRWQARLCPHPGATGACRGASSEGDEGRATP